MRNTQYRFNMIGLSFSLVVMIFSFCILILWKNSIESMRISQKVSLFAIHELLLTTQEIKMHLLSYLSPYGCSSCTKNKIKEKSDLIEKMFAELQLQDSYLKAQEDIEVARLRTGKSDLDQFVRAALDIIEKEDKEKISLMTDNDWAVVITNFIKPLNKFYDSQLLAIEEVYIKSILWIQRLTLLLSTIIIGQIGYLVLVLKRNL